MRLRVLLGVLAIGLTACGADYLTPSSHGPITQPLSSAVTPQGSAPAAATWGPWPQAGRDGSRTGASPAAGPTSGRVRWVRHLGGDATPGPVIGPDGTVYAASQAGVLHAIDPRTGLDRWSYDARGFYGSDLSTSPAVLPDSRVLWPGPHRSVIVLAADGTLLTRITLDSAPTSPAVTSDASTAFVGDTGGGLLALDLRPRIPLVRWRLALGGTSYGSAAVSPRDPHRCYVTLATGLVAVDDKGDHGVRRWQVRDDDVVEVSPAVATDGTVIFGDNGRHEWGVSPSGKRLWRFTRIARDSYSSPVVTPDGQVWFGDHSAQVSALDVHTGRLLGRFAGSTAPGRRGQSHGVWTSVALDSHRNAYWGTRSGHVYGYSRDGRQLFDVATGETVESYPALGLDGLLVIGVTDGRLLGIADN